MKKEIQKLIDHFYDDLDFFWHVALIKKKGRPIALWVIRARGSASLKDKTFKQICSLAKKHKIPCIIDPKSRTLNRAFAKKHGFKRDPENWGDMLVKS